VSMEPWKQAAGRGHHCLHYDLVSLVPTEPWKQATGRGLHPREMIGVIIGRYGQEKSLML